MAQLSGALPPIFLYDSVDSTNDLALRASGAENVHGACWVAEAQHRGRGRREVGGGRRAWHSPAGTNILMSVLLRPSIEPARAAGLTLATAAGVCGLLREICQVDLWIKWPNDLWIGQKKVCGILSEAVSAPGAVEKVVVGLGINVNIAEDEIPRELQGIMTSLRIEAGREFDRLALVHPLRRRVLDYGARYTEGGFEAILDELRAWDRTPGRAVLISHNGGWLPGISRGIDDTGGLQVEVDGRLQLVQAGEVRFVR